MNKAIVLDIDGVLLKSDVIFNEMHDLKLKNDDRWDYFHKNCNSSRVLFMDEMLRFIKNLNPSICVILSTARNEKCRQETIHRLQEENFIFNELYMRADGDKRPSQEIKQAHLKEIKKTFEIVAFIDDDLNNCCMAKEEGILALRKV
jgi:predicted secreted acid phosphatase